MLNPAYYTDSMVKGSLIGFLVGKGAREGQSGKNASKNDVFEPQKYVEVSNCGAEGRVLFSSQEDYDRFEAYLYLLNSLESPRASNLFASGRPEAIFETARGEKLVAIGAYCFTPKEFRILVTPLIRGGIGKFMQKLQTAYTMYFNAKYHRTGRVFQSAYKSESAISDAQLKYLFARVHLGAARLFDEKWQEEDDAEFLRLAANAMKYRYSSANEYVTSKYLITSPEEYPGYIARAKNAETHIRFWHHR